MSSSARWLLCATVVVTSEAPLDCARWWRSPTIVSTLTMTPQQTAVIEKLYEDSVPSRRQTSEREARLTVRVAELIQQGIFDAELLGVTQELTGIWAGEEEGRRHTLQVSANLLAPVQREHLQRLMARHLVP